MGPPEADFNRHLVYTQLEPIYARRVFPCFDEPIFKATYEISIVRPSHEYMAICNMPIDHQDEESPQRGYTTVYFKPTPLMSTFHFSVVICDFHAHLVSDPRIAFPFTIYTKEEKIVEAVQDTINIVLNAIAWCQDYFEMPFPHPKLDLIIMPELKPVSVEGVSVIIIQEGLLKVKEDYEYETLHYVLSNEIVSQWIGCSATIAWWSDMWYKEGLTMMLANLFLDENYPEVQAIPNFICYLLQPCMNSEISVSSRRINRSINDPNDISEYMDPVAFTKAASVFRMIEQVDPEFFKLGMRNFMSTYHLQNASWNQLGQCLHLSNDKNPRYSMNIENMLYTWSQNPGLPLVVAARGAKAIAMTHRRFLSSMDCKAHNLALYPTWEFPISYMLSGGPHVNLLFMRADTIDTEIRNSLPEGVEWYKVNMRQCGFYRVVYPEDDWNNIKKILLNRPHILTVEDRASLIDDMFSLARAGFLCYGRIFMTLTYLRYGKENHWLPWACLLKHLVFLKNAMSSDEADLRNFRSFMSYLMDPVLNDEVWNVSEEDDVLLRRWKMTVLKVACTMGISAAKSRLNFLKTKNEFDLKKWKPKPYLLRFLVLRHGAPINGYNDADWLALWKLYQTERNKLEKHKLLAVIASVANENQRNSLIRTIRTDDRNITDHAFFTVLYEMASSRKGALFVWNFLKNNWNYLTERFASTDSRLFLLFPHVAQSFDDDNLVSELTQFSTIAEIPTMDAAMAQAKNNVYWTTKYRRTVSSWLNNVQKVLKPLGYSKHSPLRRNKNDNMTVSGSQLVLASQTNVSLAPKSAM